MWLKSDWLKITSNSTVSFKQRQETTKKSFIPSKKPRVAVGLMSVILKPIFAFQVNISAATHCVKSDLLVN